MDEIKEKAMKLLVELYPNGGLPITVRQEVSPLQHPVAYEDDQPSQNPIWQWLAREGYLHHNGKLSHWGMLRYEGRNS